MFKWYDYALKNTPQHLQSLIEGCLNKLTEQDVIEYFSKFDGPTIRRETSERGSFGITIGSKSIITDFAIHFNLTVAQLSVIRDVFPLHVYTPGGEYYIQEEFTVSDFCELLRDLEIID